MAMSQPVVQKITPASGDTVQMKNSDNNLLVMINPATDLASLTLNWPTAPHGGQLAVVSSSKVISSLLHTGGTLNSSITSMAAIDAFVYIYDDVTLVWSLVASSKSKKVFLPYTATISGGTAVIYLTDNGLVGGNALFSSVDYVHLDFISNDPNFGKSYTLSGDLKTLTVTAVKQVFSGVTVLGINVLGAVTVSAAVNGTQLSVLVQGTPV